MNLSKLENSVVEYETCKLGNVSATGSEGNQFSQRNCTCNSVTRNQVKTTFIRTIYTEHLIFGKCINYKK